MKKIIQYFIFFSFLTFEVYASSSEGGASKSQEGAPSSEGGASKSQSERKKQLIIGCGHKDNLEAYRPPETGINLWEASLKSKEARGEHSHTKFETWDITKETGPDRVCNILDPSVVRPKDRRRFRLVYLEKLPPNEVLNKKKTFEHVFELLEEGGLLIFDNNNLCNMGIFKGELSEKVFHVEPESPFTVFLNINQSQLISFSKMTTEQKGSLNKKEVIQFLESIGFKFVQFTCYDGKNRNPFNRRKHSALYTFLKPKS